jgi:hypothetical protein
MKKGDCLFNRVIGKKSIKNRECLCRFNAPNESVPCEYINDEEGCWCEFYKDSKIWEIRRKRKEE